MLNRGNGVWSSLVYLSNIFSNLTAEEPLHAVGLELLITISQELRLLALYWVVKAWGLALSNFQLLSSLLFVEPCCPSRHWVKCGVVKVFVYMGEKWQRLPIRWDLHIEWIIELSSFRALARGLCTTDCSNAWMGGWVPREQESPVC
jgi:hypothetical protein